MDRRREGRGPSRAHEVALVPRAPLPPHGTSPSPCPHRAGTVGPRPVRRGGLRLDPPAAPETSGLDPSDAVASGAARPQHRKRRDSVRPMQLPPARPTFRRRRRDSIRPMQLPPARPARSSENVGTRSVRCGCLRLGPPSAEGVGTRSVRCGCLRRGPPAVPKTSGLDPSDAVASAATRPQHGTVGTRSVRCGCLRRGPGGAGPRVEPRGTSSERDLASPPRGMAVSGVGTAGAKKTSAGPSQERRWGRYRQEHVGGLGRRVGSLAMGCSAHPVRRRNAPGCFAIRRETGCPVQGAVVATLTTAATADAADRPAGFPDDTGPVARRHRPGPAAQPPRDPGRPPGLAVPRARPRPGSPRASRTQEPDRAPTTP